MFENGRRGGDVGSNSRYDRVRPVSDREAGEARALHTIAALVTHTPPPMDRTTAGQIAHVLDATAIELNAGRPLPIGVRRAVISLAAALRATMDPRTGPAAAGPPSSPAS
jgi:hypothetical protein